MPIATKWPRAPKRWWEKFGVAKTDISPEGKVFVHGEWWQAQSDQPIPSGAKVRVIGVDGLMLSVAPAETSKPVQVDGSVHTD